MISRSTMRLPVRCNDGDVLLRESRRGRASPAVGAGVHAWGYVPAAGGLKDVHEPLAPPIHRTRQGDRVVGHATAGCGGHEIPRTEHRRVERFSWGYAW